MLLNDSDILYIALKGIYYYFSSLKYLYFYFLGEDFNYSAILDDYAIIRELGVGGFGKVMLGRHKEDKREVAIKFMDVSENCKTISL